MSKYQEQATQLQNRQYELEILIAGLEGELSADPKFVKLQEYKQELESLWDDFTTNTLAEFENNSIKSDKGDWGKITMVERSNYKIADINKVPAKFLKKTLNRNEVKKQYEMFGKEVEGVERTVTRSLRLTQNHKESS